MSTVKYMYELKVHVCNKCTRIHTYFAENESVLGVYRISIDHDVEGSTVER